MEVTHYVVPSKEPAAYLQAKVSGGGAEKNGRLLCYSRFTGNAMYLVSSVLCLLGSDATGENL